LKKGGRSLIVVDCTPQEALPGGDTVVISKAEFKSGKSELSVEATSSDGGSVTLTVVGYGTMTYDSKKDKYKYKAKPVANPGATVTVTSSGGGSYSRHAFFDTRYVHLPGDGRTAGKRLFVFSAFAVVLARCYSR